MFMKPHEGVAGGIDLNLAHVSSSEHLLTDVFPTSQSSLCQKLELQIMNNLYILFTNLELLIDIILSSKSI